MVFNWGTALFQIIAVIFLVGAIVVFLVMMFGGLRKVSIGVDGMKNTYAVPALIIGVALFLGLNAVADSVKQSVNNVSSAVSGRPVDPPGSSYPNLQVTTSDGLVWVVDQQSNTLRAYRYNKEKNQIEFVASKNYTVDK